MKNLVGSQITRSRARVIVCRPGGGGRRCLVGPFCFTRSPCLARCKRVYRIGVGTYLLCMYSVAVAAAAAVGDAGYI